MPPRLPRYEILAELGQGGMSVVYRARDTQLPREVAVKVLHEFMARDPDARLRFHREAVAVAKLHHPGIVEIFDYSGADAAEAFIVTELIEGATLRELIEQRGALAQPELGALVAAALCEPLAHAHAAGVVHRDLKPENVMVGRGGELKLMDFGIAQLADGPRVTLTGTLLGSPAHMAPEVIDGARPDARADLFSLGTILYWLTTGQLPFTAPNPSALFRRILEGDYPDPQQVQPRLGNGLARVIRRSLERDPAARYGSAAELGDALRRELEPVGLVPVETCVRALLQDPVGYAARAHEPLVQRLVSAGKAALAEGNVARASDRLSRVLAAEPAHAEARALMARMNRHQARARVLRHAGAATVAAVTIGVLGWGLASWSAEVQPAPGERPASSARPSAAEPPPARAGEAAGPASPAASPEVPARAIASVSPSASAPPSARGASERDPSAGAAPSGEVSPRPAAPVSPRDLGPRAPAGSSAGAPVASPSATTSPRPALAPTRPPEPSTSAAPVAGGVATSARPLESARPEEPARLVTAELRLRIGNSFAHVYVDGQLTRADFFAGTLRLPLGRHTLEVKKPGFGGFRPKVLVVAEDGQISELRDGVLRRVAGELLFPVPRQGQVDLPADWVPEPR